MCLQSQTERSDSRCRKCSHLVNSSSEGGIKFNNRSYHINCFTCALCHEKLGNSQIKQFTLHDNGDPWCPQCELAHAKTCYGCEERILAGGSIGFASKSYHTDCFRCGQCQKPLANEKGLYLYESKPCCALCYTERFALRCSKCSKPIARQYTTYKNKNFHINCFVCVKCHKPLADEKGCYSHESMPCCTACHIEYFVPRCSKCSKPITDGCKTYKNKNFHSNCFVCIKCHQPLANEKGLYLHESKPCCASCHAERFAPRCSKCSKSITGKYTTYKNENFHNSCFICVKCRKPLADEKGFYSHESKPYCAGCYPKHFVP